MFADAFSTIVLDVQHQLLAALSLSPESPLPIVLFPIRLILGTLRQPIAHPSHARRHGPPPVPGHIQNIHFVESSTRQPPNSLPKRHADYSELSLTSCHVLRTNTYQSLCRLTRIPLPLPIPRFPQLPILEEGLNY